MAIRVLIADDTLFMRTLLKDILTANGFTVVGEAVTGLEAVEKYQELNPDLITMDIVMPFKSGIEALKEILTIDLDAKVVMCSALGQEQMVTEAMIAGAKAFIVKPFDEAQVMAAVKPLFPEV